MRRIFGPCRALSLGVLATLTCAATTRASADDLLTNGGFETGDFTGWTLANLGTGDPSGTFAVGNNAIDNNLIPPSPATPIAELASVGAKSGRFYAVSDSLGVGTHALLQSFVVPAAAGRTTLAFDMFVSDWNGYGALNQNGPLDHNQVDGDGNVIPTQLARVDLLKAGASAFTTDPNDIVQNFYLGEDAGIPANDYSHYQMDLTGLVTPGSAYQIRFAEVDNQFTINQGIDNVHIDAVTPEPGTLGLFLGLSLTAGAALRRRRKFARASV